MSSVKILFNIWFTEKRDATQSEATASTSQAKKSKSDVKLDANQSNYRPKMNKKEIKKAIDELSSEATQNLSPYDFYVKTRCLQRNIVHESVVYQMAMLTWLKEVSC